MRRLGYTRYVAQGGDVGAAVTDAMGRQAPEGLIGIHTNLLVPALAPGGPAGGHRGGTRGGRRDRHVQGDRLRLLPRAGHAAADDRLRPAGFTRRPGGLDARPRHRQPTTRSRAPSSTGKPSGNLTRDHILDNITLYWLTGTGASAARSYWEAGQAAARAAGQAPPPVTVPVGFTTFPGEIWRTPRSWVEQAYPTSSTSTRSTRAATSPRGRSPSCSPKRSERRSESSESREQRTDERRPASDSPSSISTVRRELARRVRPRRAGSDVLRGSPPGF